VFYRSSSKYAVANDPLGPIQNSQSMDDNIYVVTLLNSPADVIVTSGSSSGRFSVNGGLKNVTMAFQQGSQVLNEPSSSSFTAHVG
jgi:tRNA(Phe) wybutosine-synthesizing methylase Tyw3